MRMVEVHVWNSVLPAVVNWRCASSPPTPSSFSAQIAIKLAELQAPEILLRCLVKRSTDLREITCYTLANLCKSGGLLFFHLSFSTPLPA